MRLRSLTPGPSVESRTPRSHWPGCSLQPGQHVSAPSAKTPLKFRWITTTTAVFVICGSWHLRRCRSLPLAPHRQILRRFRGSLLRTAGNFRFRRNSGPMCFLINYT
jgi:hypothetical protein